MRWTAKNYNEWHSYRPLLPVKVNNEWVWFERILRRGWPTSNGNTGYFRRKYTWEYVNSEFDLIQKAYIQSEANQGLGSQAGVAAGTSLVNLARKGLVSKQTIMDHYSL